MMANKHPTNGSLHAKDDSCLADFAKPLSLKHND